MTNEDRTHVEPRELKNESVPDDLDLRGDDRQHGGVDAVKLIEAAPGSALGQTRENLPDRLERKRNTSSSEL